MKKVISLIILVLSLVMCGGLVVGDLYISEVMYDPVTEATEEWIEIYNSGPNDLNLSDFTLCGDDLLTGYYNDTDDVVYSENDFVLQSGGYALITDGDPGTTVYDAFLVDADALAFRVDAGAMCDLGLSNTGETITLTNTTITAELAYTDLAAEGYSIERYNFDYNNWAESTSEDGTPGAINSINDEVDPEIGTPDLEDNIVKTDDSVVLNVSVTDANLDTVTVDGEDLSKEGDTNYWSASLTLSDLSSPLNIVATDLAGNTDTDDSLTFTIDDVSPVITFDGATPFSDDYVQDGTQVIMNVSIIEDNLFSVTTESEEVLSKEGDTNYWSGIITLDDEDFPFFSVTSLDEAGNIAVADITFTIDDEDPEITINTPTTGYKTTQSISLDVDVTETVDCDYSIDSGLNNVTLIEGSDEGSDTIEFGSDGEKTVDVYCVDRADNTDSESVTFTIDTVVPAVDNLQVESIIELGDDVEIRVDVVDDNLEDVYVIVDNDYYEMDLESGTTYLKTFSTSKDNRELGVEDYDISFFANDSAENVNDSITDSFEIEDSVEPVITNVLTPNVEYDADVELSADVSDESSIIAVYAVIDGEDYDMNDDETEGTFVVSISDFEIDDYDIQFIAMDQYGNMNNDETDTVVVEDTVAPSVENSVIEEITEWGESVDISVDVTDSPGSGVAKVYAIIEGVYYEMELDTGSTYAVSIPDLIYDEYTVTFYANDTEENVNNEVLDSFEVKDETIPSVAINTPTADEFLETNEVELSVTATETVDCEYSLDAGQTKVTLFEENTEGSLTIDLTEHSTTINFYCEDPSENLNDTESVSITMNSEPVFDTALENQEATEDEPFSYQISVSDDDEVDDLTVTPDIDVDATGLEFNSETNEFTWTPVNNQEGEYDVSVEVCDDSGMENDCETDSFTITVEAVNDAPELDENMEISIIEDISELVSLTENVSDVDDEKTDLTLTVDQETVDDEMLLDVSIDRLGDGFVLSFDLVEDANGQTTFDVTATDLDEASDTETITINIEAVHDSVVLAELDEVDVNESVAEEYDLESFITNVEEETLTIDVDADHLDYVSIDGYVLTLLYEDETKVQDLEDTITVNVTDSEGSVFQDLVVILVPINDAPVLGGLQDVEIDEDTTESFDLADLVSDEETADEDLEFSVIPNDYLDVSFDGTEATIEPVEDFNGVTSLVFVASDGEASDNDAIIVTVNAVSDDPYLPVLVSPGNGDTVNDTSVDLEWELEDDFEEGDPDGDDVTYYVYSRNDSVEEFTLLGTTTEFSFTAEFEDQQTHMWKVFVNDSDGNNAESTEFSFDVLYNVDPEITSTPGEEVLANRKYSYQVVAEDDGELDYYVGGPEEMEIDEEGLVEWTPSAEDIGLYDGITIEVCDDKDECDEQEFNLTVKHPLVVEFIKVNGVATEEEGIVEDVRPGDKLTFQFQLTNLFTDEELDIVDGGFGIDRLPVDSDTLALFNINLQPGATSDVETVEFDVPIDAEEDYYLFGIGFDTILDGDDNEYTLIDQGRQLSVERETHKILVDNVLLSEESVNSGENIALTFDLINLGVRDERNIQITAKNTELEINFSESLDLLEIDDSISYGDVFEISELVLDGTYPIDIRISYLNGDKETITTADIVVSHINLAPTIDPAIANITFSEDSLHVIDLTTYENDLEDSDTGLTWSVDGVDETLLASVDIVAATDLVTFTPIENKFGSDMVTFTLNDSKGLTESQNVLITVTEVDDTTIVSGRTPSESELIIGEEGTVDFSITAVDDDDDLIVSWDVDVVSQENTTIMWGHEESVEGNVYSYKFMPTYPATYEVTAMVVDGQSINESWTVIVADKPVAEENDIDFDDSEGIDKATDVEISKGSGNIDFGNQEIDLSDVLDVDSNVKIEDNLVALNTDNLPTLDKPATITMKSPGLDVPVVYYDDAFTTDPNIISKICNFCIIKSYDKTSGILVFEVEHFTSFTAKDQGTAFGMSLSELEIVFDGERGTQQTKEFLIQNTGTQTLEDVAVSITSVSGKNVTIKRGSESYSNYIDEFNIPASGSERIFVTSYIGARELISKTLAAAINISAKDVDETGLNVYQSPQSKLRITNLEIETDDDDYSVIDGDTIYDVRPDTNMDFNIEVKNLYEDDDNEDQEIKRIKIEVEIKKIAKDKKKDLDEKTSSFELDPTDYEEETLTFDLPLDINEGDYKVNVLVKGKDGYGIEHTVEWQLTLQIEKEDNDLRIIEAELDDSELSCDLTTYLDVEVKNYGQEEEEEVEIEVVSSELGISERYTSVPDLEEDVFDDDSEFKHSFFIKVPKGTDARTYPISVKVFYDEDEEDDDKIVNLIVKDCEPAKKDEDKKPTAQQDEIDRAKITAQLLEQYQTQKVDSFRIDDSLRMTLYICGFVILLGVVIFMFMALITSGKKKRKY